MLHGCVVHVDVHREVYVVGMADVVLGKEERKRKMHGL